MLSSTLKMQFALISLLVISIQGFVYLYEVLYFKTPQDLRPNSSSVFRYHKVFIQLQFYFVLHKSLPHPRPPVLRRTASSYAQTCVQCFKTVVSRPITIVEQVSLTVHIPYDGCPNSCRPKALSRSPQSSGHVCSCRYRTLYAPALRSQSCR